MSRYRKVDSRIWVDEKFRDLTRDGREFFIYLLTSPHSTAWGAYVLDNLYIIADLRTTQKRVNESWREVLKSKMCLRDEKTRVVCLPNWFKYNLPSNEKTAMACIRGILDLPRSKAVIDFADSSEWVRQKLANLNLTISEPDPKRVVMSTEQEQEQRTGARKPPKLTDSEFMEMIKTNGAYQGIDIDREKGKCEAWCITKHRMFSRRTFINWLNRAEKPLFGGNGTGGSTTDDIHTLGEKIRKQREAKNAGST
jgi:hypothetical protein